MPNLLGLLGACIALQLAACGLHCTLRALNQCWPSGSQAQMCGKKGKISKSGLLCHTPQCQQSRLRCALDRLGASKVLVLAPSEQHRPACLRQTAQAWRSQLRLRSTLAERKRNMRQFAANTECLKSPPFLRLLPGISTPATPSLLHVRQAATSFQSMVEGGTLRKLKPKTKPGFLRAGPRNPHQYSYTCPQVLTSCAHEECWCGLHTVMRNPQQ